MESPPPQGFWQPVLVWTQNYSASKLRRDMLAGLTVAVVEVPQAMAYAMIAGVPAEYGIYTSILQGFIGALLSSSEHIATGPTNTQSLLVASIVARLAASDPTLYLQMVFVLTILKGLIQLSFAAAKLGDLVRFVSRTVIVAISAGGGLLIIAGQVPALLGIDLTHTPRHWPGLIGQIERILPHIHDLQWQPLAVVGLTLAVMLAVRAVNRLLPSALLGIIAGAFLVTFTGWGTEQGVQTVAALPHALPGFLWPSLTLDQLRSLLSGALALAVLGSIESVAIAKAIGSHTGQPINADREFMAQGLMNSLTGFFQCIPGSVSFTRSALVVDAGAATRWATGFNSLFVALFFLLLAKQAQYIPLASLGAVLLVIALGLIRTGQMIKLARASHTDAIVLVATLGSLIVLPLEYAIFIGIFVNLGLYLRQASRLHLTQMVPSRAGPFQERPIEDRAGNRAVMFLQIEGDLFFAVADDLRDQLAAVQASGVRVVILRVKRTHSIDSTVLAVIEAFVKQMRATGRHVIICGLQPELLETLERFGLVKLLGRTNVFLTAPGVFTSAKQALQRARVLAGSSIDDQGIDTADSDEPSYQI